MYLFLLILVIQTSTIAFKTDQICSRGSRFNDKYSRKPHDCYEVCNQQCSTMKNRHYTDSRFKGRYSFPVTTMSRKKCDDPEAMQMINRGLPIILENCSFARPAYKWTIDYLDENLKDKDHITYVSSERRFLFFDEDKLIDGYKNWTPPHEKKLMYFREFLEMAKNLSEANNGTRSYFQSPLYIIEGVSSALEKDIDSFDYSWLLDIVLRLGWGDEIINLLLIGMPDVVTPAHYDILENFFVQISGYKRVILFSPDYFKSLYPYPVGHPHDRQSQVNFDNPDFEKFPKFLELEGVEAVLGPGDVMYIPIYWWHYVESETNNMTVSLNFWFNPENDTIQANLHKKVPIKHELHNTKNESTPSEPKKSFTPTEELVLKREIESMIYETTRDHHKVVQVLKEILTGRFGFLDSSTNLKQTN